MREKNKHIPVNTLPAGTREGIIIMRTSSDGPLKAKEAGRSHRDNGHLFILQEKGTTHIEIDFQQHHIEGSSIIYIHPSQVHRVIAFKKATICTWIITSENVLPEYLEILEYLTPVKVLALDAKTRAVISDTASLCITVADRKEEKLYNSILKESFNTLVALVVSQYLGQSKSTDHYSRPELISKSFKSALEQHFISVKSPAEYAKQLNISTAYLNECVKNTTGHSVSFHIQQRVILEAKRLLHHSGKTVKEISGELQYDDHSYFIRLFVKVTGMTPLAFRSKYHD